MFDRMLTCRTICQSICGRITFREWPCGYVNGHARIGPPLDGSNRHCSALKWAKSRTSIHLLYRSPWLNPNTPIAGNNAGNKSVDTLADLMWYMVRSFTGNRWRPVSETDISTRRHCVVYYDELSAGWRS